MNERQHTPRTDQRRSAGIRHLLAAAVLVAATILAPSVVGQSVVEGSVQAASFDLEDAGPLDARAYLVGFRTNGGDESPNQWSFHAEHLEVRLEHQHYVGDVVPVPQGNTTEVKRHEDASGVLLERFALSYLLATSNQPDDPAASFGLAADVAADSLALGSSVAFSTEAVAEDDEIPANPLGENEYRRQYNQPWVNLVHDAAVEGAVSLRGDFTIHVFDARFQVHDSAGQWSYNASYGGARGDDLPSPVHEYNNTLAQLRFSNATFTLLPRGRPVQLNLQIASTHAQGAVYFSEAQGFLEYGDVRSALDGSLVELDARDLSLTASPVDAGGQLRYGLELAGIVSSASVDGRSVPLPQTAQVPSGDAAGQDARVGLATPAGWNEAWWLVTLGLALLAGILEGTRRYMLSYRARKDPAYVIRKGNEALDVGYVTRARVLSTRVLRHHPEFHEAVVLRAMTQIKRNENEEALAFLNPYLFGPVDEEGILSFMYTLALRQAQGVEKARDFFRQASKRIPAIVQSARDYQEKAKDYFLKLDQAGAASYI